MGVIVFALKAVFVAALCVFAGWVFLAGAIEVIAPMLGIVQVYV